MLERFKGKEGKRRLLDALLLQKVVHGTPDMASELAAAVRPEKFKKGDFLAKQGDEDTDMFFLLGGSVDVIVNERVLATRKAGEHVGEMSVIDSGACRSASLQAVETTVAARITEPQFTQIAANFPTIWRYLAIVLGQRLRERNQWTRPPNAKPHVFVGSSVESLSVAQEIQSIFSHDKYVVKVWTDRVFLPSSTAVVDLKTQVEWADFAIMVFSPDDTVTSRKKRSPAARDNVVFEFGLFLGSLGPERTFLVKPRGGKLKLPTDLLGMKPLEYDGTFDPAEITSAIGPVCTEIRKRIGELSMK